MQKPFKIAAISGVIILIIGIIWTIISNIITYISPESMVLTVVGGIVIISLLILSFFYYYGFIALGRKFKSTLLVVMGWIGLATTGLLIALLFVGIIFASIGVASAQSDMDNPFGDLDEPLTDGDLAGILMVFFAIFLAIWIIFSLVFGAYSVLLGIGLLKIQDKVEYAKVAGILNIVAGATYIIFIGFFIRIVANIFEILMFFKVSQKYEK